MSADSPSSQNTAEEHNEKNMRKVAGTALAGTSIEWYDFFIYGTAAALVFPTAFFPEDMPVMVALIASFSTFAVGFIARPLGGVIFGHYGDRVGRKKTLVVALLIMGGGTTLIGLLPTYETIGVLAPLALVFLRFVQGLAIGGQWGGAMLLVTESAPKDRRGFYGAFAQAGAPAGVILANLAFLAIGAKDIKRLIAYTSISHFGFITMGIFAMTSQAQSGAILYMFNHGFSTAALFLVAGWMISRRGSSTISDFGGLQRVTPIMAWTFFLAGLSSLALPGLSSFVSEFLVLVGTFTRYPVHAIIATFGIVLAALYILIPVQKALHGPTTPGNENLKDLNLREKLAIAPVIAIIVVLGFYPAPLLKVINPAASYVITQMGFTDPAPTNGGK